jgi:hypothetical protein
MSDNIELTDREKIAQFNRSYWAKYNSHCIQCSKICKQSAYTTIIQCHQYNRLLD